MRSNSQQGPVNAISPASPIPMQERSCARSPTRGLSYEELRTRARSCALGFSPPGAMAGVWSGYPMTPPTSKAKRSTSMDGYIMSAYPLSRAITPPPERLAPPTCTTRAAYSR